MAAVSLPAEVKPRSAAARFRGSAEDRHMRVQRRRPEVILDVQGEVIEMGAFCEGVPECWLAWTEGEDVVQGQGDRILKILLNFTASSTVPASVIQTRGAAVCSLVESLEYSGRRCEV